MSLVPDLSLCYLLLCLSLTLPHPTTPLGRFWPHPSLAAEGLLGGVDHVEEAVLVTLLLVDLRDGGGHADHAVLVDQEEEGLGGVELQPAPNDLHQLTHVDMVRHQELGFVQDGQLFLSLVALDDDRNLVGVLLPDLLYLFASVCECPSLLKRPVGWHHCRLLEHKEAVQNTSKQVAFSLFSLFSLAASNVYALYSLY